MFGAIIKATNSSFQKGMTICHSIYLKKVIDLLAFIFEQPSYLTLLRLKSGVDPRFLEKGVLTYKGMEVIFADFISFSLNIS